MRGRSAFVGFVAGLIATSVFAQSAKDATPRPVEVFSAWTRPTFPAAEYAARRKAALAQLKPGEVWLVPGAEGTSAGETFRQLDDFEYFVGLEVPRSLLVMDQSTGLSTLFTPARDPRFENPRRPNDFPGRALSTDPFLGESSGLDRVESDTGLATFLEALIRGGARVRIDLGSGANSNRFMASPSIFETPPPGALLATHLKARFPDVIIEDANALVARLRMVKSEREIAVMRRAVQATSEAIVRGAAHVRAGVDERSLTGAFIADCMSLGAQRPAFTPIIKSGDNSLWPWRILGAHYDRRNRTLREGEMVIYDVGCEVDHYVSDVGRTFPVSSSFTPRQRGLVEMVRRISDAVIRAAKPGLTLSDLQAIADREIPTAAKPYMQAPLYFGHHIGLDAGDPSIAEAPLQPGMIFTIEPWYYNHDEGVAVFIEDEILITAKGCENLTASLPRDATSLEKLRRGRSTPVVRSVR
ncbi:MAG: Xaa-Pro peptidase family protein [Vicinamibacteria bacterium]